MKKQILFVSNDAALMGAPMVLLHIMRWLKKNTDCDIHILTKDGGALLPKFEQLGQTYLWRPGQTSSSLKKRFTSALTKRMGKTGSFIPFPSHLEEQKIDLIYLNTADTLHLTPLLKEKYGCPVIAHIHELSYSINAYFPEAFNQANVGLINHFIAASNSVSDNLIQNHHLPSGKISVINECIAIDEVLKPTLQPSAVKKELGLTNQFIVGASGVGGWRKGTDLFLQVAKMVNNMLPDNRISFVWVGHLSAEIDAQCKYEIEKLNLQSKVIFTGSQPTPQNYFQIFDLFTLTSREDPFPLVCLEAAALQKPIFCFRDSGGIPEIIDGTNGRSFDYADITAMAAGIIAAYQHPEETIEAGKNAAEMIKKYDVNAIAPKISSLINSYFDPA